MRSFMRTGFDNDKYLKIQSEHIKERLVSLVTSFILNLEANYLMITTLQECFRDFSQTASFRCLCSYQMLLR